MTQYIKSPAEKAEAFDRLIKAKEAAREAKATRKVGTPGYNSTLKRTAPAQAKKQKPIKQKGARGKELDKVDADVRKIVKARDFGRCVATNFFGASPIGFDEPIDMDHIYPKGGKGASLRPCTANALMLSRGWHMIKHGADIRYSLKIDWQKVDEETAAITMVYKRPDLETQVGFTVPIEWVREQPKYTTQGEV